jgi:hypothetical protein
VAFLLMASQMVVIVVIQSPAQVMSMAMACNVNNFNVLNASVADLG